MEKPIKVETSSSGGKIEYFTWGLKHTAGRRYNSGADKVINTEDTDDRQEAESE